MKQQMFTADEISDGCARMCLKNQRSFEVTIRDPHGQEVMRTRRSSIFCFAATCGICFEVYYIEGKYFIYRCGFFSVVNWMGFISGKIAELGYQRY